jgi:hyaluronan synthase
MEARVANSTDREMTAYVMADKLGKEILKEVRNTEYNLSLSRRLKNAAAKYDDAEDRLLTAQTLEQWKTVYVPSAIVYTDVPVKLRNFLRQQQRWKKGALRTNFFVSSFFWKKRHPVMTFIFYLDFMSTFSAPLIAVALLFYLPFIRNELLYPLLILGSTILVEGLAVGVDYKMRDPSSKNWLFKPVMNMITNFILAWLLFPALWNLRKNAWGTR